MWPTGWHERTDFYMWMESEERLLVLAPSRGGEMIRPASAVHVAESGRTNF